MREEVVAVIVERARAHVVSFFFNDTATTEIYTLSLHDALPIWFRGRDRTAPHRTAPHRTAPRSEEHTSELQSPCNLVCRLLLEKKTTAPVYTGTVPFPPLLSLVMVTPSPQ